MLDNQVLLLICFVVWGVTMFCTGAICLLCFIHKRGHLHRLVDKSANDLEKGPLHYLWEIIIDKGIQWENTFTRPQLRRRRTVVISSGNG